MAADVARALFDAGHEVSILTSAPRVTLHALVPLSKDESGLQAYRLFPLNIASYEDLGKLSAPLRILWRLLELFNLHAAVAVFFILRRARPEAILTHNLLGLGGLLPFILRLSRTLWVHTIHDVQLVAPSGILRPEKEKTAGGLFAVMSRLQFGSPDVIVSPSRWLLDFYTSRIFFPKSKKTVICNPVKRQVPITNRDPDRIHKNLNQSVGTTSDKRQAANAPLRLLYVGQIEEHKGILWLVEALRSFRGEFELRVVGGGAKLAYLRRATSGDSRHVLRGPVAPEQLPAYFSEADLTVVPSLALENCPGVILESLVAGTPVLASRVGGISELISEGKNGWLFAPGDVEDLRSRLSFCIQNRTLLAEMRASAQESVGNMAMNRYLDSLIPLLSQAP